MSASWTDAARVYPSAGALSFTLPRQVSLGVGGNCGNLIILPDTQDGAVSHQDRPARIPWSVGVRVRVPDAACIMLVCESEPMTTCHAFRR
jgi:hypothetical protein